MLAHLSSCDVHNLHGVALKEAVAPFAQSADSDRNDAEAPALDHSYTSPLSISSALKISKILLNYHESNLMYIRKHVKEYCVLSIE